MKLREIPFGAQFKFAQEVVERINARYAYMAELERQTYVISKDHVFEMNALPQFLPSNAGLLPITSVGHRVFGPYFPAGMEPLDAEVEMTKSAPSAYSYNRLPDRQIFTTSCDPELFLQDGKGNIVPGFSVLPLKKDPGRASYGVYHEDGFQAEFSPNPEHCHHNVLNYASRTMGEMLTCARNKAKDPTITLSPLNFVEIPQAMLDAATDEQAALGCDPSLNVYGTAPFIVENPRMFPYRAAGGHIHLGSPKIAKTLHDMAEPIIKSMDVFAGVASVALFEGIEDPRRRQFYGRAGEFRKQPHGLEYRTLSNAWLTSPAVAHVVFNLARGAFRFGMYAAAEIDKFDSSRIRHIIDTYDVLEARKFITENEAAFTYVMNHDSGYQWAPNALRLMHLGVKNVVKGWNKWEKRWINASLPDFQSSHRKLYRILTPEQRVEALGTLKYRRAEMRGYRKHVKYVQALVADQRRIQQAAFQASLQATAPSTGILRDEYGRFASRQNAWMPPAERAG